MTAGAALLRDNCVIAEFTLNDKKTHSQTLLPMIDEIVKFTGINMRELDAVAISAGPGSYTGLRIGSATAKGFGLALNIPLIGIDVAKKLLGSHSLEELIQIARESEDPAVFSAIDGIGPEKSSAFVSWIKEDANLSDLRDLLGEVTVEASETKPSGNRCEGLVFVVTGDVHHYPNRNALKAYIESQGGKVTGSVSKSTNYLINNDPESSSSKNTKARALGIPLISEDDFIEQFVN